MGKNGRVARQCWFWHSGKCFRGMECCYLHEGPSPKTSQQRRSSQPQPWSAISSVKDHAVGTFGGNAVGAKGTKRKAQAPLEAVTGEIDVISDIEIDSGAAFREQAPAPPTTSGGPLLAIEDAPTQQEPAPPGFFLHSVMAPAPETPHELLVPVSPLMSPPLPYATCTTGFGESQSGRAREDLGTRLTQISGGPLLAIEDEPTRQEPAPAGFFLHSVMAPAPNRPHELLVPRAPLMLPPLPGESEKEGFGESQSGRAQEELAKETEQRRAKQAAAAEAARKAEEEWLAKETEQRRAKQAAAAVAKKAEEERLAKETEQRRAKQAAAAEAARKAEEERLANEAEQRRAKQAAAAVAKKAEEERLAKETEQRRAKQAAAAEAARKAEEERLANEAEQRRAKQAAAAEAAKKAEEERLAKETEQRRAKQAAAAEAAKKAEEERLAKEAEQRRGKQAAAAEAAGNAHEEREDRDTETEMTAAEVTEDESSCESSGDEGLLIKAEACDLKEASRLCFLLLRAASDKLKENPRIQRPWAVAACLLDARLEDANPSLFWRCFRHFFPRPATSSRFPHVSLCEMLLINWRNDLRARCKVQHGLTCLYIPSDMYDAKQPLS
ncbi:unnamed protein product [Symbiodinium natans]|uniref:C3H1-type domain-containing protein n=1 Tax=Symbiodinium natans TaxID=878477 RepID=A0A812L4E6_9DINO|nr:unnamed protein product [Symbiodinium natans]